MQKLPTWVEVDLDGVVSNVHAIRAELADHVKLLLTVKADAYGHGAVQVVQATRDLADYFGVATVDEALEIRAAGIAANILILSPVLDDEVPVVVDNNLAITVASRRTGKAGGALCGRPGPDVGSSH